MMQIWVNPLAFPKLDGLPPAIEPRDDATAEEILEFLAGAEVANDIPAMVKRYREITAAAPRLFAVPAEPRILEKLVWPIRQAKASYVIGNYLATIALCGMVSEMVAILLFETANIQMNNVPMDDKAQVALYGSTFEKLRQERRTKVLRCYGGITEEQEKAFDELRGTRTKYLHLWSKSHDSLPEDALKAFAAATKVVVAVIGAGAGPGGKLVITEVMKRYLAKTASPIVVALSQQGGAEPAKPSDGGP